MDESIVSPSKTDLQKLRWLKSFLLISVSIFLVRYILLIISIIWSDFFTFKDVPILYIVQIGLAIIAFSMFCYGLMGIREYFSTKKQKRIMKSVVWTLLSIIFLIIGVLIYWTLTGYTEITESFPYELWLESIFIAMPFTELIPLTISMLFLAYSFWLIRNDKGWRTNVLITPFFLLPITIVRILAAIFKIINILDSTKYPFAWDMADYSRIIYAVIGMLLFAEIIFYVWRMKPKQILQS